ncbi:MAG TPA: tetratricopeptide repeat protein, partial [Methylomirabilota bacterium]|nr:tetratricopeptide repeat protein [Methylomirabilota bacterium]
EALVLLAPFRTKYPDSKHLPEARFLLGWVKVATGDAQDGVRDLRQFVAAYPTHGQVPAARRLILQSQARSADPADMAEAYRGLMQQQPSTAEGLYDAASIAGRLGRVRDKQAAWRRLRAEFPDHALTRRAALEMATAAFKQQSWKDATTLAEEAAKSGDNAVKAEAWLLAGESELKLKRFASAARAFEAVGEVTDADPGVRYRALAGLGLVREEQQQWRAALTAYEAVASDSPDATLRGWARERATAVKARLETRTTPARPPARPAPKKTEKRP